MCAAVTHRAVIIGCGRMGSEGFGTPFVYDHASTYLVLPQRVKLVGVCDIEFEKAILAGARTGANAYRDFQQMLKEESPDIVSICTRVSLRHQILDAMAALGNTRMAAWVEKPPASSPNALGAFLKPRPGISIQVNYIRRFDPTHQELKASLDRGDLGNILWVRCLYSGGMLENGSHFVDLFRWWGLLDKAEFIETDDCAGRVTEVEVMGTKGRVRLLEGGLTVECEGPGESPWFPSVQAWVKYERAFRQRDLLTPAWPPKTFMSEALVNILNHLDYGEPLLSPASEAAESLREAWRISLEGGFRW